MKTEELMQLGISREQADSILAINGRDIEHAKSANQQERLELERLKGELAEKEQELDGFRSMDLDGLKAELAEWKNRALDAENSAKEQAEKTVLRSETERMYRERGVKNAEVLDALVDWQKVSLEEGVPKGLSEQLDSLCGQYGYLFEQGGEPPRFSAAAEEMNEADTAGAVREAMGI